MKMFTPRRDGQTRTFFRVLAGLLAMFTLLVSLPMALYEARTGTLSDWLMVLCCICGGVGLAVGAKTGHWFNSHA